MSDIKRYLHTKIPYSYMEDELIHRVARTGCLVGGHFELLSGQHSSIFFRFSRFASESGNVVEVTRALSDSLTTNRIAVDGVISPDTAGIILAYEFASHLGVPRFVVKTGDEKTPSVLLNHINIAPGANILLVNDVVTTGHGMQVMRQMVEQRGASVAAAAVFCLRKNKYRDPVNWLPQGKRLFAISDLSVENETFGRPREQPGRDCPLCTAGVEITPSSELN